MANIQVPTNEQVDNKAQGIFAALKKQLGMVPNLYAAIGYSSNTLESFLGFSGPAGKGTFTNKEIEAIKLAVSQTNDCDYCLAAHTALAKMNGFTQEETLDLRTATIADARLNAITTLAKEISADAGRASQTALDNFFAQGFNEAGLIDLIAVIISVTFTNYVYGATEVPVDFPAAQPLETVAA